MAPDGPKDGHGQTYIPQRGIIKGVNFFLEELTNFELMSRKANRKSQKLLLHLKVAGKSRGIPIYLHLYNPLYTGRLFHCYMLDKSSCHFRAVLSNLLLLF